MTDTSPTLTEAEQTALARLRAGTHVIVPVEQRLEWKDEGNSDGFKRRQDEAYTAYFEANKRVRAFTGATSHPEWRRLLGEARIARETLQIAFDRLRSQASK